MRSKHALARVFDYIFERGLTAVMTMCFVTRPIGFDKRRVYCRMVLAKLFDDGKCKLCC